MQLNANNIMTTVLICHSEIQCFEYFKMLKWKKVLNWYNIPLDRKKNPVFKIYFPRNDTPTTHEGFSPSAVVMCHFQGRKFYKGFFSNQWYIIFYITQVSLSPCRSSDFFSGIFPPHPLFLGRNNQIQTKIWSLVGENERGI